MNMTFSMAKDRNGSYGIDWSQLNNNGLSLAGNIEFIPFSRGDARTMSLPTEESMLTGVGDQRSGKLTYAIFAFRIGDMALHLTLPPSGLRQLAERFTALADLIEGKA